MCRMEPIPRTGTTPHHSCWHGSGPVDNGHGAHQTPSFHVANISPPKVFTFSVAPCRMTCRLCSVVVFLRSAISRVLDCASGHRLSSVRLVTQPLGESVKSGLHQSECALGCLILITAIHHVRNSLPPHVCFDLFLSSTVTVKDEGPCGGAGTGPWKPPAQGPSTELCELATAPAWSSMSVLGKCELSRAWGRVGRLANCRPKSVTLGDGGGLRHVDLCSLGGLN